MEPKKNYGLFMRKFAEEKHVSQTELARRMGVTQSTVNGYYSAESGSVETIDRFCSALDCSSWQFYAYVDTQLPPKIFEMIEIMSRIPINKRVSVLRIFESSVDLAMA